MIGLEPYSPSAFRNFYSNEKERRKKDRDISVDYPVMEDNKLGIEKRGRFFNPTEQKHSAFCKTVELYLKRENELLGMPELNKVNCWVKDEGRPYKFKRITERDVRIAKPNLTMQEWFDISVDLSSTSISVLHNAEVEVMKAVIANDPDLVEKTVEDLIGAFCQVTSRRDLDWECKLKQFICNEVKDIRRLCIQHAAELVDGDTAIVEKDFDTLQADGMEALEAAVEKFRKVPPKVVATARDVHQRQKSELKNYTRSLFAGRFSGGRGVQALPAAKPTRFHRNLERLSELPLETVMRYTEGLNVQDFGASDLANQMKAYEAALPVLEYEFGVGPEGFRHIVGDSLFNLRTVRKLKSGRGEHDARKLGFAIVQKMGLAAPHCIEEYKVFLSYMEKHGDEEQSLAMSLVAVAGPEVQFSQAKRWLDDVKKSSGEPDQPVSPQFNEHPVHEITFEDALEASNEEYEAMSAHVDPLTMEQQKAASASILKYQYGLIDKGQAQAEIIQNCNKSVLMSKLQELKTAQPVRQSLVTEAENRELEIIHEVVQEHYAHQLDGSSNCQSFANALECFFRFGRFNQVVGVAEQIEIAFDHNQTTPVVGWYQADGLDKQHRDQFQTNVEDFYEAARKGQMREDVQEKRETLEALDCDRYIVLKQRGTGHYMFMHRMKSSGRFFVIDAQNRQMYPLLHPDGSPTDEAIADFEGRSVQVYSPEWMDDGTFEVELEKCNRCLASDHKFGELIAVYESIDRIPPDKRESMEKAAKWLATNVPEAPSEKKILEGLEVSPGRKLWPTIWDGRYQLFRPAEIESRRLRLTQFDPGKVPDDVHLFALSLLKKLPPEQRVSRRAANEALRAMRNREVVKQQHEDIDIAEQKILWKQAFDEIKSMPDPTEADQFHVAMEHVYYEQGYSETELNILFPTEEQWLATCGPDVDLSNEEAAAKLMTSVANRSGLTNLEVMKRLMAEIHQLSDEARTSRARAAGEFQTLFPDLGMTASEIEADLSRVFSETGWSNLWGDITTRFFQIKDDLKLELTGRSPKAMKWD